MASSSIEFIAMCGLPGSGKTTIANRLARAFGFFVSNGDKFRKGVFFPATQSRDDDFLWFSDAASRTADGAAAVLDATFHTRQKRKHLYAYCAQHSIALLVIQPLIDQAVLHVRLERQVRDGEKIFHHPIDEVLAAYKRTYQSPLQDPEKPMVLTADQVTGNIAVHNPAAFALQAGITAEIASLYRAYREAEGSRSRGFGNVGAGCPKKGVQSLGYSKPSDDRSY